MNGEIPIRNIYHLLCYAWDYLPEAGEVEIVSEDAHSLDELLARVLSNGTAHLLRQGLDRDYRIHREETSRLRGRFDLTASFSRQTIRQGRLVCEFDELSYDVLHNRILKTTLALLAQIPEINGETRALLHQQMKVMREITPVRITSRLFRRVRLHRNNRAYRLLLNVCELVHESLLPDEQRGNSRFRDFIRDDNTMPRLFEAFVKNFYTRHSDFKVSAAHLHWDIRADEKTSALVPRMETDVSLYSPERQIIIDCKFYKNAFSDRQGVERFRRDHLFQLFAYLENAGHSKGWGAVEGMLLYPAIGEEFAYSMVLNGHRLGLRSVNLNLDWKEVERQLMGILGAA